MKLKSTISWSALATIIRLSNGFVSMKVVALITGPLGVALVGQFSNFTSIVMTLALGGISTGVIKYTSQHKDDLLELQKIWRTIIWISGVLIIPIVIVLLIGHNWLSQKFLHDARYGSILLIFAFSLVFYVANNLLLNILNGMHDIKRFNLLNTSNSTLGLMITIFLVYRYNVYGALLSIVISQSITFFIIVFFIHKQSWFKLYNFFGTFDKDYFRKLLNFTAMSLTSVCVIPTSQMFVRGYLASHTSWDIAGCWQGIQKVSDAYLTIVYTALGTYFLPKLSSLYSNDEIRKEIKNCYMVVLPFVVISAVIIYLCRNFIIELLFAKSFSSMSDMFFWQLIGDFFKISSFILAYLMLAKSKTKIFMSTEIVFGLSFPLFSYILINYLGANGVVMAFALNYFLYFLLFIVIYRKGYLF